jgi:hypothetical protein
MVFEGYHHILLKNPGPFIEKQILLYLYGQRFNFAGFKYNPYRII